MSFRPAPGYKNLTQEQINVFNRVQGRVFGNVLAKSLDDLVESLRLSKEDAGVAADLLVQHVIHNSLNHKSGPNPHQQYVMKTPFIDLSVNRGQVYYDVHNKLNWYNYIRTNTAGNFNGGGLGNKMICGLLGYNNGEDGIPIMDMPKIEFEYTTRQPTTPTAASHPYFQGIANFDVQRIVSFDSTLNAGGVTGSNAVFGNSTLGQYSLKRTLISGTTFKAEADISQHLMYIVVTGLAVNVIPGAIEGEHYVVQPGAGATNSATYWTFVTYLPSKVAELYPDAKFYDSYVTDGGAPKSKMMTGLYFGVGDSSTNTYFHHRVNSVKVNDELIF